MSKKCVAFSKSKLGLEKPDNRKSFYAGWEAAIREALAEQQDKPEECANGCPENMVCDYCQGQVMDELQAAGQEIQPEYYAEPVLTGLKISTVDGQSEFEPVYSEPKCNPHPDAPHGFDRNASHSAGRYVCECEGWKPDEFLTEYKEAYDVWIEKTEWVQKTGKPHELGMHRADILKQRIQELEQQNAALKAVVDAWNNVDPVKQEPVAYPCEIITADFEENTITVEMLTDGYKVSAGTKYLCDAPVDSKAIRAEALEEAAKVCEQIDTAAFGGERPAPNDCAAAIRGLK